MEGGVRTTPQSDVVSLTFCLTPWEESGLNRVSSGNEPILDGALREVTKIVQQAGIKLCDETEEHGKDSDGLDGWDGGVIWLVPTDKPISEWGKPIATRKI